MLGQMGRGACKTSDAPLAALLIGSKCALTVYKCCFFAGDYANTCVDRPAQAIELLHENRMVPA